MNATLTTPEPAQVRPEPATCTECDEPAVWTHPDHPERRLCRRHNDARLLCLYLSWNRAVAQVGAGQAGLERLADGFDRMQALLDEARAAAGGA